MPISDRLELSADRLNRRLDPSRFAFATTADVNPLEGTVGQPRAIDALEFGLSINTAGFNLFVTGLPGSGRLSTVRDHLERVARTRPAPRDWVYVHDFAQPDRPIAVSVPTGSAKELARDFDDFVVQARRRITETFDGEAYRRRRGAVASGVEGQMAELRRELESIALAGGFALEFTPGMSLVPIQSGHPLTPQEIQQLTPEQREDLDHRAAVVHDAVEVEMPKLRQLERAGIERLGALDKETALGAVTPLLQTLREKYVDEPALVDHLRAIEDDIANHLFDFRDAPQTAEPPPGAGAPGAQREESADRYRINVLVGNAAADHAPVVIEQNPTYYNLLGRVEYRATFGSMVTDYMHIRAGALHRANGGFLVIEAAALLQQSHAWEALKRALRTGRITIENLAEQVTLVPTASLQPQPVPLDIKVVLIGDPRLYQMLNASDQDLRGLFKVRADFAPEMAWDEQNVMSYAAFIRRTVESCGLHHFTPAGVARIVEHGSRLREDQRKLTTRLGEIADIASEASFWAEAAGHELVEADDVDTAIEKREHRSNLPEERLRELIDERTINVETDGERVGQVNGLSVVELGDHSFGLPTRITASTSIGRGRFESVERETRVSGPIHSKGFLILSGYLMEKYAQEYPLPVRTTITFEQSYDEVEGDSASSTELYAILSALSGLPIRQGIAVTGSVDQRGNVQAVGGVTKKVEGFFAACAARGLTGTQGVMIPESNVENLTLSEDVVQAVRDGRFHVWAVSSIDEGIELLTGHPAGTRRDGRYPKNSVHGRIAQRCRDDAERLRRYAQTDGEPAAHPEA